MEQKTLITAENTSWWHKICLKSAEIRFVLGRPKFGDASHGLPFPLAVVVFAPNIKVCKVGTYDWKQKVSNER